MKTIGMIGGMSWESSAVYYQQINREVRKRLGGVCSAKLLIYSFNFGEMAKLQHAGKWDEANASMVKIACDLEKAGADFLLIACNTMHCATAAIQKAVRLPLLHIADPLGAAIRGAGLTCVGLLGSNYTMQNDSVLRGRLCERYGVGIVTPEGEDATEVNRVIYDELARGEFLPASRAHYRIIIAKLVEKGAQGIILGCTELSLLLSAEDAAVPMFDTTTLHTMAAVELALA